MATLLILLSAALYGVSPILVKVAYAYGVPPLTVLALRSTIAASCLWGWLTVTGRRIRVPRSSLAPLFTMGATLVPAQVFPYFLALAYLPASSASVLAYTYPLHVAWMGWLFLREPVRPDEGAILIGVVGGALLVAGQTPSLGNSLGLVAVAAASLTAATYTVVARRVARHVLPLAAMAILLPASAVPYWTAALVAGQLRWFIPLPALLAIAVSAAVAALAAPFLVLAGLREVPAARAAMLGTLEPVVTVSLSVLLLRDAMTPIRAAGIAIVICGVTALHVRRSV